jgi:hypothetical protein
MQADDGKRHEGGGNLLRNNNGTVGGEGKGGAGDERCGGGLMARLVLLMGIEVGGLEFISSEWADESDGTARGVCEDVICQILEIMVALLHHGGSMAAAVQSSPFSPSNLRSICMELPALAALLSPQAPLSGTSNIAGRNRKAELVQSLVQFCQLADTTKVTASNDRTKQLPTKLPV